MVFYDLLFLCLICIYCIILVCYRNGVLCFTCIIMVVVISIFRNIHKLIEVFLVFWCNLQTDSLPDIKGSKPKLSNSHPVCSRLEFNRISYDYVAF